MAKTNGATLSPEQRATALIEQAVHGEFQPSNNGMPRSDAVGKIEEILRDLHDDERGRFHQELARYYSAVRDVLPALLRLSDAAQRRLGSNPRPVSREQRQNAGAATFQPSELEERMAAEERGIPA